MKQINQIAVHSSATKASATHVNAEVIRRWHKAKGWRDIGYHVVICRDGKIEFGRDFDDQGAHVLNHNHDSWGICLVGGLDENGKPENNYTREQMVSLYLVIKMLQRAAPNAEVLGHRDLSPDKNGDGKITSIDWLKACPCFDVRAWLNDVKRTNKIRASA